MAEQGRRALVQDPLELNVNAQAPDRSLGLGGVRNPNQSGGDAAIQQQTGLMKAIGGLTSAIGEVFEAKKDDWQTEGKLAYMRGATEAEIDAQGNQYTKQGWQALNTVAKANEWYTSELTALQNGGYEKDPASYQKELTERRAKALENLPADPAQRKLFVAAFDDLGPRLMSQHTTAHNEYNKKQYYAAGRKLLASGGANADATRKEPGQPLEMSPGVVRTVPKVPPPAEDVDILVKTMLGEANGEGDTGLAAVAHVILNRVQDGRYGRNIREVALAPKQFSTWNSGAGGNNPGRFTPDNPAYQQAKKVAEAVLSGRNVDMTNGATHYFSPKGMQDLKDQGAQSHLVPSWWPEQVKLAGGEVVIGGHKFAGKARNAQTGSEATNVAVASNARGADPAIINKYKNTSDEDLKAMAEDKKSPDWMRAETAAVLQGRLGGGPQAGERGGENARLSNSGTVEVSANAKPVDVAASQGVVTKEVPSGPSTQLQAQLRGLPGMRPNEKGDMAADEMIEQLKSGNDQIYRDLGGIGILNELGADSAKVRMVQTAYKQFQDQQLNKFNLEDQKWQSGVMEGVREGKITHDEALEAINRRVQTNRMSDQHAKSLAGRVAAEADKAGKAFNFSYEAQRDLATLYQAQVSGRLTTEQAYAKLQELAKDHDLPQKQVEKYVAQMFATEQSAYDKAITTSQTEAKKRQETLDGKAAAEAAVARGGLKQLSGPHIMHNGENMTREQYGIAYLKEKEFAAARAQVEQIVAAKGETARRDAIGQTTAVAEGIIYANLVKQDVVDEKLKAAMTAAGTGNIIMKDGKVDPDAMRAFDTYMRLAKDPNVGVEYMDKYFANEESKNLILTAHELYTGGDNIEQSMRKAHELMSQRPNKGDPLKPVDIGDGFAVKARGKVLAKMDEIKNTSWMSVPTFQGGAAQPTQAALDSTVSLVERNAKINMLRNPHVSADVNIDKAVTQITAGTVLVGRNLIYGDDKQGLRLDQVMGIESYGKDAPHKAIDFAVARYMKDNRDKYMQDGKNDVSGWGKWARDNFVPSATNPLGLNVPWQTAPYLATYDAHGGTLTVIPYKDSEMKELANVKPYVINVRAAGAEFREREQQSIFTGDNPFAKALKIVPNLFGKAGDISRADAAGSRVGKMIADQ